MVINPSDKVRAAIRTVGWAKYAQELMREDGEYVPETLDVAGCARSLSMKVAAADVEDGTILDGIAGLGEVL